LNSASGSSGNFPANYPNTWLRLIALIYLAIGLYVLFRRWTAPGSTHFYIFCVVSFVFYAFKYTGKLNGFDWTIYWGNAAAWLLQPALFLHFALTFPEEHEFLKKRRWLLPAIYVPGGTLLVFHVLSKVFSRASEMLRWQMDRMEMAYLVLYFALAALVFLHSYRGATRPILRQQLKWVTRGTILAIAPFTLFYVVPYLTGAMPSSAMKRDEIRWYSFRPPDKRRPVLLLTRGCSSHCDVFARRFFSGLGVMSTR